MLLNSIKADVLSLNFLQYFLTYGFQNADITLNCVRFYVNNLLNIGKICFYVIKCLIVFHCCLIYINEYIVHILFCRQIKKKNMNCNLNCLNLNCF